MILTVIDIELQQDHKIHLILIRGILDLEQYIENKERKMLDRFKVPEQDKIYVPVERITAVTENILKASGVSEEGAKNSTAVLFLETVLKRHLIGYAKTVMRALSNIDYL